ncbi:flagellar protein FlgN [Pandoraea apista]|uniref:flagellar protein FlgN n=1 Tax=Pandoraea apista TaxID=93218 RepID=UPI0021ADC1EE|nr:flagellar protein FlgN [Pandoraea apista]
MEGFAIDRNRHADMSKLLDRQFAAALRRDASSLTETGDEILALANVLGASHETRRKEIRALVAPMKPESVAQVCEALPGTARDKLMREWAQFELRVLECSRLNQRNAALMTSQYATMQRVLQGEVDTYVYR